MLIESGRLRRPGGLTPPTPLAKRQLVLVPLGLEISIQGGATSNPFSWSSFFTPNGTSMDLLGPTAFPVPRHDTRSTPASSPHWGLRSQGSLPIFSTYCASITRGFCASISASVVDCVSSTGATAGAAHATTGGSTPICRNSSWSGWGSGKANIPALRILKHSTLDCMKSGCM